MTRESSCRVTMSERRVMSRDLVLIKKVWERSQKNSHFKAASNSFWSKTLKRCGSRRSRVPVSLHSWLCHNNTVLWQLTMLKWRIQGGGSLGQLAPQTAVAPT